MHNIKLDRRNFIKALGLTAAPFIMPGLGAGKAVAKSQKKPNVLVITVDDLGWSDLGCYGSDLHETPNIDKLAAQGQIFTNAYAAAPVCSPTRASFLTGKYPAKLNMTIWREAAQNKKFDQKLIPPDVNSNLPLDEITIAEVLNSASYTTAHLGKWHVGDFEHFPELQGFDINAGATVWGCPPTYFYPYRGTMSFGSFRFTPGLQKDRTGQYRLDREGEYLTDRLTDEALNILEDIKEQPFYMNMSYYTVHTPIEAKPDIVEYYEKKIKPGMKNQNPIFAAMVHILDENVGRILNKLDELGLNDNTVVFLTSDNGGVSHLWRDMRITSNYPLRSGKGSLYDGGIRVPLIVKWPGKTTAGSKSHYPTSTQDYYPTLLEIADTEGDVQHNQELDGVSLVPILKDPEKKLPRDTLYWHYPHYYPTTAPVSAVRQGDWKLLHFYEDDSFELYNLAQDIGEEHNLAQKYPDKVKELSVKMKKWLKQVKAPMPKPNPDYQPK